MIHKNLIEVLLFSTPEPLTQVKLNQIIPDENVDLREIIDEINLEYEKFGKALFIEEIGGGFQILTKPEYHYYIQRLYNKSKKFQLSRPAMEALSIIAYRQPISKVEVESIRGVNCDSVVKSLMERELITIKGREEGLGRALLYGTTQHFLEAFGLNRISDLPKLKELSELMDDGQTPTEVLDATE